MKSDQYKRYKNLLSFIDAKFKEEINIHKVEEVSNYSYRNINRIFYALHQESIGQYIKRLRLEKAAQYLKYSESNISDIAFKVAFEDVAAFSKAFKKKYNCSPSAFRNSNNAIQKIIKKATASDNEEQKSLDFEIEYLPEFEFLCLEYRGAYDNIAALDEIWEDLITYGERQKLMDSDVIPMAQILDDNEISETINCRYHVALALRKSITFEPEGLFQLKRHKRQKYVKFIHKGSHESSIDTYNNIYSNWMLDVNLEFEDLPSLEFFLTDEDLTPQEELVTEIYIPVK